MAFADVVATLGYDPLLSHSKWAFKMPRHSEDSKDKAGLAEAPIQYPIYAEAPFGSDRPTATKIADKLRQMIGSTAEGIKGGYAKSLLRDVRYFFDKLPGGLSGIEGNVAALRMVWHGRTDDLAKICRLTISGVVRGDAYKAYAFMKKLGDSRRKEAIDLASVSDLPRLRLMAATGN